MLDAAQIRQTDTQLTAVIRLTIPRAQIRTVMGPGVRELFATLASQGVAPTGPWFSHHLRMDSQLFDFEIGVPVSAPVSAEGRVIPGQLPAAKLARAVYYGTYDGLDAAWGEFNAWIAAQGHAPRPNFWECYLAGPESSPDPAAWRTELNRPIAG